MKSRWVCSAISQSSNLRCLLSDNQSSMNLMNRDSVKWLVSERQQFDPAPLLYNTLPSMERPPTNNLNTTRNHDVQPRRCLRPRQHFQLRRRNIRSANGWCVPPSHRPHSSSLEIRYLPIAREMSDVPRQRMRSRICNRSSHQNLSRGPRLRRRRVTKHVIACQRDCEVEWLEK